MRIHRWILFCFLYYTGILYAQTSKLYTTKDGLPSNLVYDILEDEKGFIWFATNRGIVKYDGENFKVFTTKDGLPNNDTWLLETDAKGRVWFFSKSKYQGYVDNDILVVLKTENNKVINPVYLDKNYDPFIIVSADGIFEPVGASLKTRDDTIKVYRNPLTVIENYDEYNETVIFSNGPKMPNLYLKKDRLITLDENFNTVNSFQFETSQIYGTASRSNPTATGLGRFIYCSKAAIIQYNNETETVVTFPLNNAGLERHNRTNRVYFSDCSTQISLNGYNYLFDANLNLKKSIDVQKKAPDVQKSFIDSRGHLWVLTPKGVRLFTQYQQDAFTNYKDGSIHKLAKVNGSILAGQNNVGYFNYNADSGSFQTKPFLKNNINVYISLSESNSKKVYIQSNNSLYSYDGINPSSPLPSEYTIGNRIENSAIVKDYIAIDDTLAYCIQSTVIMKRNLKSNKAAIFLRKSGLLKFQKYEERLFVAGSDGLHEIMGNNLRKAVPNNELAATSVLNTISTPDELFIATDGNGVYQYIPKAEKIISIKSTEGLIVQNLILEKDTLWLATQQGVKKLLLKNNNIANSKIIDQFYQADGLMDDNVNDFLKLGNQMMVATEEGVSTINITNDDFKKKPQLYVESQGGCIVRNFSKQDNISVSFGAIDFSNQENLLFSYRLVPQQKEWIGTSTRAVNFTNLSPGNHSLEIKAINQHFREGTISLPIIIKPLWYQTNIAKMLFVFLSALVLFTLFYFGLKTIRRSERKRNDRDKKVAGLELQALRSQMNPHFVHNSLNAIQYYIQRNEVELSENYLSKFSKLIRMFFEYSRRDAIKLKDEIELITHYLDMEKLRFEDKLSYQIDVDINLDVEEQLIPSMILQPIIENAVNHGIFHKNANGRVRVNFEVINDGFAIIIEDNGIGFKKAQEIHRNSTKNYQSRSSAVLHERIELLGQSNEWIIEHTMVDLSDISEEQGTRVILNFKTGDL